MPKISNNHQVFCLLTIIILCFHIAVADSEPKPKAEKGLTVPNPPADVLASGFGGSEPSIRIGWFPAEEGLEPTSYTLYTSLDAIEFDEGRIFSSDVFATETEYDLGETRFFRLTASNESGESEPTPIVGARIGSDFCSSLVIVNSYERMDEIVTPDQNTQDYIVDYIKAFTAADPDIRLSSTTGPMGNQESLVELREHDNFVWFTGLDSFGVKTLDNSEIFNIINHYSARREGSGFCPGNKSSHFITGTNIATDLILNSRDVDSLYPFIRTSSIFSENILQLESDGERTDERSVSGLENDIFEGLELELSYFGDSPYSVRYADILTPSSLSS